MSEHDSSTLDKALSKTVKVMLKPLVKLLLQKGITYTALLEPLKQIFVEVAEESFSLTHKKQTDSRISLLTGVHRKEVKRLRDIDHQASLPDIKAGTSAQIMALWTGHPDYLSPEGLPIPLSKQGPSPSFEDLVYRVSKDKHPRSILDDWLNQSIVQITSENHVELNEAGFVPQEDREEKLFFAGKNIGTHLKVVTNNLEADMPPMFERAVYYRNLTPESVKQIELSAREKSLSMLTEINKLGSELQQQDQNAPNAHSAFHLGSYFYRDIQTDAREDKS